MADQSRVNYGMEKLKNALGTLEAFVERLDEDRKNKEVALADNDSVVVRKAELEKELGAEKAKVQVLQDANSEVSERLEAAAENIRDVLRSAV